MEIGTKVRWDFHGFKGDGILDHIDGTRYYIRPSQRIVSHSLFDYEPLDSWPFVVVYEDQVRAI